MSNTNWLHVCHTSNKFVNWYKLSLSFKVKPLLSLGWRLCSPYKFSDVLLYFYAWSAEHGSAYRDSYSSNFSSAMTYFLGLEFEVAFKCHHKAPRAKS